MGLSIALMQGFAQGAAGIGAALRQQQAQAQAQAQADAEATAQLAKLGQEKEDRKFQRELAERKMRLEEERFELEKQPKAPEQARVEDPVRAALREAKTIFREDRTPVGSVFIDRRTGQTLPPEQYQAEIQKLVAKYTPAPTVGGAAPAPGAGAPATPATGAQLTTEEEELRSFSRSLSPEERARLNALPSDEALVELRAKLKVDKAREVQFPGQEFEDVFNAQRLERAKKSIPGQEFKDVFNAQRFERAKKSILETERIERSKTSRAGKDKALAQLAARLRQQWVS